MPAVIIELSSDELRLLRSYAARQGSLIARGPLAGQGSVPKLLRQLALRAVEREEAQETPGELDQDPQRVLLLAIEKGTASMQLLLKLAALLPASSAQSASGG